MSGRAFLRPRTAALRLVAAAPRCVHSWLNCISPAKLISVCSAMLLLATSVAPSAHGAIISSDTTIGETNFTYDGLDIVVDGATLTLNGPHRFRSLLLTNKATLTHSPCTADKTYKLDVTVTNLLRVMKDSLIDVRGRGYLPGRTSGNTTVGASTGNSGGSYGGMGGARDGTANQTYGDPDMPNDWGSGGAGNGQATAGGGLIAIRAGTLHLDKYSRVNADGGATQDGCGGGGSNGGRGSGGSVLIAVKTLVGNGIISANGFNASVSPSRGAGGGGRIAVYAVDLSSFNTNQISALGGDECGGAGGLPGTIRIGERLLFPEASTQALGMDRGTNSLVARDRNGTVGWAFNVLERIEVTHLGLFDGSGSGLQEAHSVGLWSESGTQLARADVPSGTNLFFDAGFRFVPIPVVSLFPGRYVISAFYNTNSPDQLPIEASSISNTEAIAYDGARASSQNGDPFPDLSVGGRNYFGPNFRFVQKTPADLEILQSVSTNFLALGGQVIFWLTVTNRSTNEAFGVTITATVDNFSNFVASATQGTTASLDRYLNANLGNIAPGASATVTLTVVPQLSGPLIVSSEVSGGNPDPIPLNNHVTSYATVLGSRSTAFWRFVSIPALPSDTWVERIWARTRDEAYAIAYQSFSRKAYLYRWNGTIWREVAGEVFFDVRVGSVFGVGNSEVFVSFFDLTSARSRVRRSVDSGSSFTEQTLPDLASRSALRDFGGTVGNVQAATENRQHVIRFDGIAWDRIEPGSGIELIYFASPVDGFYVGCNTRGSWDGVNWRSDGSAPSCDLKSTWAVRNEHGLHWYAVGNEGSANGLRIWKFDTNSSSFATVFTEGQSQQTGSANSVWGSDYDDVYVVGDLGTQPGGGRAGRVHHFDGHSWAAVPGLGALPPAGCVHGTGRDDVWIALRDGRLLHNVAYAPPRFVETPTNVVSNPGGSVTFRIVVTGDGPFHFQWRRNGVNIPGREGESFPVNIPGAEGRSLTITNVQIEDGGSYALVVEGAGGAVTSDPAILFITLPILSVNDSFANRIPLTGANGTNGAEQGNRGFTLETGEPLHAGKTNGASAWYTWTAPTNGIATFNTIGSSFDTVLGVYTGSELTNLVEVASSDDAERYFTSKVAFNAQAGVSYPIAVAGYATNQGAIVLAYDLEATEETLPVILRQPTNHTAILGSFTTFTVSAQGSNLTYSWFLDGNLLPGRASPTLILDPVQLADVGTYTVRITNTFGRGVESLRAALETGPFPSGFTHFYDKAEDAFFTGRSTEVPFEPASGGAGFVAASFVPPGAGTIITRNVGGTTEEFETNHCRVLGNASLHVAFYTTFPGMLQIDTRGSQIETILTIYQIQITNGNKVFKEYKVCDTQGPDEQFSRVFMPTPPGPTDFEAVVDGLNRATGLIQVNFAFPPPGLDPIHPFQVMLKDGGVVIEPTLINAGRTTSFRWTLNSTTTTQPHWTNATLELSGPLMANLGEYFLMASNAAGRSTSSIPLSHLELASLHSVVVRRPASRPFVLQSVTNLQFTNWSNLTNFAKTNGPGVPAVETNYWYEPQLPVSPTLFFRGMIPSDTTRSP